MISPHFLFIVIAILHIHSLDHPRQENLITFLFKAISALRSKKQQALEENQITCGSVAKSDR
jgi:hypothetical protein